MDEVDLKVQRGWSIYHIIADAPEAFSSTGPGLLPSHPLHDARDTLLHEFPEAVLREHPEADPDVALWSSSALVSNLLSITMIQTVQGPHRGDQGHSI